MELNHKTTGYAFLALLGASLGLEFGLGILLLRLFWGTAWLPNGHGTSISLAGVIAQTFDDAYSHAVFLSRGRAPAHLGWTASGVIAFWIWVFVAAHVVNACWFGLLQPSLKRRRLGARWPEDEEREEFERAFAQIATAYGEPMSPPRRWQSADGLGQQMRWVSSTLIIDRELYGKRWFVPLLAHELGNSNSEYRIAQRLYALLPAPRSVVGTLAGLPFALGHVLTYPLWMWYWRQRVFASDDFAARAGQGPALQRALEKLYLRQDRATKWGREWKQVPYVAQRIGRLKRLRYP